MKQLFYSFLLIITVVACYNGKAEKKKTTADNIAISKVDTDKMANFPGTAIYIELPKGFVWNETAMGFYRDEDGSVIKYDEFKTMRYAANMPVEESAGSLTNRQPIIISGFKGELKTYQEGSTGIKLSLYFGDNTFMNFIEGSYFNSRVQTEKEILAAFKTIQVKKQ